MTRAGQAQPAGVFIGGISPRRALDDGYRAVYTLAAGHVATAIATARAFEDARERADALAELDRTKTAFFQNVSHELRTPLTLILGPLEEMLARADTVQTPVRGGLELARRNAVRLSRLVNTLLDFSRIEAGRARLAAELTDLPAFTADVASTFRSTIELAGLALVVETTPLDLAVCVDREMWERVVLNLLSNAFKHTFSGEIRVRVFPRQGNVVLQIADTGVGIPGDQLPRIFERFYRVPGARSRTNEGTGIGLALVQELVKLHDGAVQVESVVDRGTTFTVSIPAISEPARSPSQVDRGPERSTLAARSAAYVDEARRWLPGDHDAHSLPHHVPSPSAIADARVLVADDNADMRQYTAHLLEERGWAVEMVADGEAALAAARERPPDLVVADVMMPGHDGFALLHALRRDPATQSIPVILLSARAGEEARVEGVNAGAADYVVKPFSARELVARVERQLERARAAATELRAEEERRAAEARAREQLETLFSQAPVAICVFRGAEHRIVLANEFYRRMLPTAEPGRRFADILPEAEAQGYVALLTRVFETGEPWEGRGVELYYDRHGTGSPERAYFNALYYPLVESGGTRSGVVAVIVEMTAEVKARHEAELARADAETANRTKAEFLASMSHELRTPLNAIGGYAQLLDMGLHGPVTDEQHVALDRLQRSQQRLLSLINDLLNFAKLEAGELQYHVDDVGLAEVVGSVVPVLEPEFQIKHLAFEARVDSRIRVRADREKLEQILLNLLSNAVKFTASGGRVSITSELDGPFARIRVADTGRGIPAGSLERIFEPFVQVDATLTRESPGTGLGLAISRDLARGMGGDLTVESEVGKGSTFTVAIPAV